MFMSYELHLHNLFGFLNADMIYEWSLGSPDVDEQVPEEGDLDVEVRDHLKYCLKFPLGGLCKTANIPRLIWCLLFNFQYDTQTSLPFECITCIPYRVFKVQAHQSVCRDHVVKLVRELTNNLTI